MMLGKSLCILTALLFIAHVATAQSPIVWSGTVVDSATGETINGASIRVVGTTKGTYSRSGGSFRLPLDDSKSWKIDVRSVGYSERRVSLDPNVRTLRIALAASATTTNTVVVTSEIRPEEVIQRAIQKKDENAKRLKSLVYTLYSKVRVKTDLRGIEDDTSDVIMETFSRVHERRGDTPQTAVRILQRRQTKNMPAGSNLAVWDNFFDFTLDELNILNTRLVTPLGKDALDEYEYRIVSKKPLGSLMVYEIAFEPKARIFPGFEGSLTIVEGTYQIIAADFAPTQQTAIPFLTGLRFEQRYERHDDSVWIPTFQVSSASAGANIFAGIASFGLRFYAQSWVTDAEVNVDIPDSMFVQRRDTNSSVTVETESTTMSIKTTRLVTVDSQADSTKSEFWDSHAYAEPTPEEQQVYAHLDTAGPKEIERREARRRKDSLASEGVNESGFGLLKGKITNDIGWSVLPMLDFSHITDLVWGGKLTLGSPRLFVEGMLGFGKAETRVGSAGVTWKAITGKDFRMDLRLSAFSRLATIQGARAFGANFFELSVENLVYSAWMDYYRRDGFGVEADFFIHGITAELSYTESRHIVLPIINAPNGRQSLSAEEGAWRTVVGSFVYGAKSFLEDMLGSGSPVRGGLDVLYARHMIDTDRDAWRLVATAGATIPTFATGYNPMTLDVDVTAGRADVDAPIQYQIAGRRRYPIFQRTTHMMTVPVNAYAGTEFVTAQAEHNFSDMWWRLLGLPTYNGRGVDLIGIARGLNMTQRAGAVEAGRIYDSTPGWYTEVGVGIGRIPTFISDFLFLRFDAVLPVGPVAAPRGTFGWSLTISSPIM